MNKQEIIKELETNHNNLIQWLAGHDADKWVEGPEGKWSTGEHIIHLIQSMKPVNLAMILPPFVLKYRFGKANRATRPYNDVIQKYRGRLIENPNVVAAVSRNMPKMTPADKPKVLSKFTKEKDRLIKRIVNASDQKLDTCILPHPLLGRMPLREILMWSAYHIDHHAETLRHKY